MCLDVELISTTDYHFVPGRFRVSIPTIKGDQKRAELLAAGLAKLPHISGSISPRTGRILLIYDPRMVDPGQVLQAIAHLVHRIRQRADRPERRSIPWHILRPDRVLELTGTSPERGLTTAVARRRLEIFGPNQLVEKTRKQAPMMFMESLQGFMSRLLLGAAAVSFLVGQRKDAAVIATIVALQAALETVQGYRAEKSLEALRELSAPVALVRRDGKLERIPAERVVPGDLIELKAGDQVPADARLLEGGFLLTDESCLTGESIPVAKEAIVYKHADLFSADQLNMLFAGTNIMQGKAAAVVTATGMDTEMGKIATLLTETHQEETSLHRQMELLGKRTTGLVLISVGAIIVVGLFRRRPIAELLSTGVSLAVGAIPEGLPAVVTVALAFGVQRMARRNAIVRRLSAVETLGSVTTICSDKTGTLTANEMTVRKVYSEGEYYTITGAGYLPMGQFYRGGLRIDPLRRPGLKQALISGALCNNAELQQKRTGRWQVLGDPTEGALLTLAAKAGIWPNLLRPRFTRLSEMAFDASRKMMSVACLNAQNELTIHCKGATEVVLPRCSFVFSDGQIRPLGPTERTGILQANRHLADQALRVLCLAFSRPKTGPAPIQETDLVFAGLVGMADPARRGVKEAIQQCRQAGIKVVMITGDHQNTAEAVAKNLGILDHGTVLSGKTLQGASEEELSRLVPKGAVFARISPEQKLLIVRELQKQGQIVAMTGDGINDAPAVKQADIGIAMGRSGTDVTRQAAGITLSDDNFLTIVAGVEEGRTVAANIGRATRYILPGNWGQVLAVFLASVSGYSAPLVPAQILWINLVTEGFPALTMAADPPMAHYMTHGPNLPQQALFSADATRKMVRKALLSGLTTYGLYASGLSLFGWDQLKAQSMAFAHMVLSRAFSMFEGRESLGKALPAAGLSTAMLLSTLYIPWFNPLFQTTPLQVRDWGLLGLTAGFLGRLDRWVGR